MIRRLFLLAAVYSTLVFDALSREIDFNDVKDNPTFPAMKPRPDTENDNNQECDLVVDSSICIFNGEKVLAPSARPKDLIGHWSFDDDKVLDSSGLKNHGKNEIPPGPSFGGSGHSAYFNGVDFVEIPHSPEFLSKVFSITFWLFLIRDFGEDIKQKKGVRWCPIVQKGVDDSFEKIYFRAPAIFFDRKERSLKVLMSTTDATTYPQGESLLSSARVPYHRWTHVALVRSDKKLKLYINGILDAVNATEGWSAPNDMPLFIGNTPWHKDDCNVPSYIDEFRFYKRELRDHEIEAEASPALGGIEPNFIQLGCINCPIEQAAKSCVEGYHICTSIELHTGGYQVARAMGWVEWNTNVWSHGAIIKVQNGGSLGEEANLGLGICCSDLK